MGKGERLTAVLTGGPPWGFRLSGGLEVKQPLKVAKVRKKSKAHGSGLQEGDEVVAVNGTPCQDFTHKDCMGIVEGATDKLEVEVLRKRPTYNVQSTEQEESGSKLEIKVNSVAKKDKQHVSTLQIKPVTVSANSVKSESRREVSAVSVAREESSQRSQVVQSTGYNYSAKEAEYSTLERKSKNVSKVNGLGQVSVFTGGAPTEGEETDEKVIHGFSYLKPGDIRSLGQSGPPEEKHRKVAPPTASRSSQQEFPSTPPPSYNRALTEPQYQQVHSPTAGPPGHRPFQEEEPPPSAFRSVKPPGPQKSEPPQGIIGQSGPLPWQQQQIQEPQAVTSSQPAVQRPTPIRQQPTTAYQPERQAGSPHTWSAGVPKQDPVPASQAPTQQPASSYPFSQPTPYSQPPASAPSQPSQHKWTPPGRSKPKTPITPTTPTEASPNKLFSPFDVGATWEPPNEEDEREIGNMMDAKPKAPMFKVSKFDFKPQTWSEGSSSGRPMTQEDFQTMDLPLGPMGQYRNKQREMLAYEKSGAVWSPSGTTPVSGPKTWSPGGGDAEDRSYEAQNQAWSPPGRSLAAQQPQSHQPAPGVWSPGGGGGQAPKPAQNAGSPGAPSASNGVWRPSQMPATSQGYYSEQRDSGIWSPGQSPQTATQASAPSRSFSDTEGYTATPTFDPRPKVVSAQSSSARSAAASLKKPGTPGRGKAKVVGPTKVGPLPSYLNIQEEQTRHASEHFMTVKPTPALTSTEPSKTTLQALPTRSYLEIQQQPKPEPENAAEKEKKQKQRLHPKSISEYYNLPPEAAIPDKDKTKRIPVSEIEPINFNVDLEDKSRCTHQTPEMLSHDAARRLAEATFFEEGKGANMFMKRMERMSKYVIDESNVKKAPQKIEAPPNPQQQWQQQQQKKTAPSVQEMKDMVAQLSYKRAPKSPWEAAMEGSGKVEEAFSHIRGDKLLLDLPAGSQQEYDPFDPTVPFPGSADMGGEGVSSWASQDGMNEQPTSPTGPQFKDFNLKPRGWVSSGGGYLSDQLGTDYESDTNLSTASAPARPLFKVSKVTVKEPSVWLPGQ